MHRGDSGNSAVALLFKTYVAYRGESWWLLGVA